MQAPSVAAFGRARGRQRETEFGAAALRPGHPLADFRVGIGLATGHAVAGGIGAKDQLNKVTVFGPVVNLA